MSETKPSRRPTLWATVAIVAIASLLTGVTSVYAANKFSDVPNSNPFHDDIGWLSDAGITTGYGDGTFRPNSPVTRGEMAAFMRRFFDLQVKQSWAVGESLSGTVATSWVDIPGASTAVTVPPGAAATFLATFTGDARCSGPVDGDFCSVRLLMNGTEMTPAVGVDNAFGAVPTVWSSAVVARAGSGGPGVYTFKAQYRVGAVAGTSMAVDNWLLSVDPQFVGPA